jgi:hypothetical protein
VIFGVPTGAIALAVVIGGMLLLPYLESSRRHNDQPAPQYLTVKSPSDSRAAGGKPKPNPKPIVSRINRSRATGRGGRGR